jgi:ATP-dependent DNA helicase DinG
MGGWYEIELLIEAFIHCIDTADLAEGEGMSRFRPLLEEYKSLIVFYNAAQPTWIRWVERFKHSFILHLSPFEISQLFLSQLALRSASYLFTSATLTVNESFDCFTQPLGLEKAQKLIVPSPFDYRKQALLYLPRGLPDTNSSDYYDLLIEKVLPLINACQGRCFFLFTSHKALKLVAMKLATAINFPLLVQGQEAKSILLTRFRKAGNAVLLGTATFWEGVDVKGEALSCVIIDKLPFPSPGDPIIKGKSAWLQSTGQSGFFALTLPMAVLALKQGIGRLIRDINDRGILVLADPRLTGRAYGQQVFASLPAIPKTRDAKKAITFIQQLDSKHETIGN